MNDLLTDWKNTAIALLGALVTLLGWLGKDYAKRVRRLEEESVTREYVDSKHDENIERFDRLEAKIDTGITGTHQRIDKLFERLPERK